MTIAKATISDEEALAPITKAAAARDAAGAAVLAAVRDARSRGIAWVEIASALSVTYQAAHQRYAHRV